jgi:flavin-dependent dehydrogenase
MQCENIDLCLGHRVVGVEFASEEWRVEAVAEKERRILRARLVVAADGRHSPMAKLSGNESEQQENQRSALFGYFEDIAAPDYNRSLFILSEPERGFVYPLCRGRTLLALYVPKVGPEDWQSRRTSWADDVKAYFHRFRGLPDLSDGRLVSPVFGYSDYPNLARKADWKGMAFIGDAALSLDPLSGVGCAFAMVSANLLANATTLPLLEESSLDDGLAAYQAQFSKVILPHARGIHADSLIAKSEATSLQTYRCIAGDPVLQRQFVDLTGRLISPIAFQRAFTSAMVRSHIAVH